MEITITTHSPSHTQLPSNWDWLLFIRSTGRKTVNTEACKYACRFSVKHGNLPFLPTHLIASSGKILVLPGGQALCLRRGTPSTCCARCSPTGAVPVISWKCCCCSVHRPGHQISCTISSVVHLHSACIQVAGKDVPLPGIKSQLLLLKMELEEEQAGIMFSFQTVNEVAYLLFPITLTQHFSGKSIHPGHGGPRFNSLLHLREDKPISSGHTLAIRLHKGTFSSC